MNPIPITTQGVTEMPIPAKHMKVAAANLHRLLLLWGEVFSLLEEAEDMTPEHVVENADAVGRLNTAREVIRDIQSQIAWQYSNSCSGLEAEISLTTKSPRKPR